MNDKELADRVVALGVFRYWNNDSARGYVIMDSHELSAEHFVRDWRVAGALMEKCIVYEGLPWVDIWNNPIEFLDFCGEQINEQSIHELPRAIIEACVEALT